MSERVLDAVESRARQIGGAIHKSGAIPASCWRQAIAERFLHEPVRDSEWAERIIADHLGDDHVLELRPDGYGLQHPLACRPNLLDCPYELASRKLAGDEAEYGRWTVELRDNGTLRFLALRAGAGPGTEKTDAV